MRMTNRVGLSAVVVAAALAAGNAMAVESAFENHLQSAPMVSPAQIYQVQDNKTDFSLGYASAGLSTKPDTGETKNTTTGTELFAATVYNIQAIGLRTGLTVNYLTGKNENKAPGAATDSSDINSFVVTPEVAYPVGPVVLGAALDVTQDTDKPESADTMKATYNTFRPGVLYANSNMEAGVTYASATHIIPTNEGLEEAIPANVSLHGRYALDRNLAVGAILGSNHYKGLDADALKDQTTFTATGEYGMGAVKLEGDLGYESAFYKNKDSIDADNIGAYTVGAAADYAVNPMTAVGGAIDYAMGSDSANGSKYAKNDLNIALRGNMRF